ncbi:hypothetical protein ACFFRR_008731 [Megaselia abdita]
MQTCGPDRSVDFEGLQCTDKYYHKLCVAPRKAETYFTYHIVQPFLKNAGADCNEEWKSCVYIYQSEEGAYNVDKQFEHFAVLRFNQISIKKRRYFVHHNFVPCADIGNQNCTCYVEQSAPAFVAVKEGNLKRVENFIRKAIVNPTEVITGQFGQLKLLNSRNVLSEMYLENIKDSGAELLSTLTTISKISRDISGDELGSSSFDSNRHRNSEKKKQQEAALNAARGLQPLNKLNVPEIFYKLIRDTVTNEGMVILTSNNPFLDKMESSPLNMMCRENLCEFTTNLQKSVDGYTYCCDVEEFTNNLRSLYRIAFDGIIDYRSVKRPSDIRGMLIRGGLLEG